MSIKQKTKRRPYIRSRYFNKEKVFIDTFWQHIWQKNWHDRMRRLRYLPCAVDLLKNTTIDPVTIQNNNNPQEILHRFYGLSKDKKVFIVQVKEHKRTNQKALISVFPPK